MSGIGVHSKVPDIGRRCLAIDNKALRRARPGPCSERRKQPFRERLALHVLVLVICASTALATVKHTSGQPSIAASAPSVRVSLLTTDTERALVSSSGVEYLEATITVGPRASSPAAVAGSEAQPVREHVPDSDSSNETGRQTSETAPSDSPPDLTEQRATEVVADAAPPAEATTEASDQPDEGSATVPLVASPIQEPPAPTATETEKTETSETEEVEEQPALVAAVTEPVQEEQQSVNQVDERGQQQNEPASGGVTLGQEQAASDTVSETVTVASTGAAVPVDPVASSQVQVLNYIVRPGDTVFKIASRQGITMDTIIANNPDLWNSPDYITPGQQLRIPNANGLVHTVKPGETLWIIANQYGVSLDLLLQENYRPNPDMIYPGDNILLPGAWLKMVTASAASSSGAAPPTPQPAPAATTPPPAMSEATASESRRMASTVSTGSATATSAQASSSSMFIWPSTGRISSNFGAPRRGLASPYHTGIDIDGGTVAVRAAASGRVVNVAYESGYGNYIVIEHGNGWRTLYAHLSRTDVQTGQYVEQGHTIGMTGATGYATGVHLHFEIQQHGRAVDPLHYLP